LKLEEFKKVNLPLKNFIQTKAKPIIYYIPKQMNAESNELLKRTSENIEGLIINQ
jgi:hypothetical protein